jgi:ribosomal subunit interface protein
METPLQITMQNVPRSEALEARIRESAGKLEQFHPRITSCRVAVDEIDKHHRQGREYRVRVEVHAPGHEKAISTLHHHEDVYVALRDAFDSARRQLEDRVREARGDVKRHARARHGRVARLDATEGFGFIETDDGDEVYFSRDNVVSPAFASLEPGTEVQFIEEPAGEGVQAKRVSAGKHHFEG